MNLFFAIFSLFSLSGVSSAGSPRIVGGQEASLGQFPYQVVVYVIDSDENAFICGGSIIDRSWILTAGHCTYERVRAIVIAGSVDISSPTLNQQVVFVNNEEDLITHPDYSRPKVENDIALVHLPTPLNFTDHISAATLEINDDSLYLGENVTASGFGRIADDSKSSKQLRWTTLEVIENSDCASHYDPGMFDETKLCTTSGTQASPTSTCQGDSGGPLVLTDSVQQIGLVSFGGDSCEVGTPVAFTRINSHKNFIEITTGLTF